MSDKSEAAKREEEILTFWKENGIFEKTLEKEAPNGEFVFYDGPPFATGLPHQGSLLSSVSKDLIPRYKTMRGYRVRRRWGWDTHGLPIESLVEKKLGLKNKKEILALGIEAFNETARSMVLEYVHDWKRYVERVGRFVDFDNSYKTMDNSFIESVWWALKEIHGKGRLYEGRKVLMYCPHCETPLAKAEIAMDNTYKDVIDETATVKFKMKVPEKHGFPQNTYLLAWTTTPWTLPGNVALAVNSDITYSALTVEQDMESFSLKKGETIVLADAAVSRVLQLNPEETLKPVYEKKELAGSNLIGIEYEPLYEIEKVAAHTGKKWEVLSADFVTATDGTGIVHTAVIYGEDDYQLGLKEGLPMVPILNPNATYNDDAPEFIRGKYIKKAEADIKADLNARGRLFTVFPHTHSYPHCYRCGTALIYNAVSSWFIDVQSIKKRLIDENETINWSPDHLKQGRFKHNLESAPDWTISRNRFWASPLPIWKDKQGAVRVIGSLEELKNMSRKSGNSYFAMRHGESTNNLTETNSTVLGGAEIEHNLTATGKEVVRSSAAAFTEKPFDLVLVSPFTRTKETAKIIQETLGLSDEQIIVEPRLREIAAGDYEGGTYEAYRGQFASVVSRFDTAPEGGETLNDVRRRAGELLYELEATHRGKRILLVTHGDVLWMLKLVEVGSAKETAVAVIDPPRGTIEELKFVPLPHNRDYELDFHLPYIDRVELVDENGEALTRIPEVVDCWVESGSMPFAEYHYPFENQEQFNKRAVGDFVSEYIGQTRAWFYYMHTMGVQLFDHAPFKNVLTTGTILAADGTKLSKSKKNYTDPYALFDAYSADAFRLYLMSSVVMQAEDLMFRDDDVKEAQNRVVNMLRNVHSFFRMYADDIDDTHVGKTTHVLDRWILARLEEVIQASTHALDRYDIIHATRTIRPFVDDLSTWYLRRSRDRMKGEDKQQALHTLKHVLKDFAKMIAPVMPFVAEEIFLGLKDTNDPESVHLTSWPSVHPPLFSIGNRNASLLQNMQKTREVVSEALQLRQKSGIKVRQPLASLTIPTHLPSEFRTLIAEEVNVKEIREGSELVLDTVLTPELVQEGDVREFMRAVADARKEMNLSPKDVVVLRVSRNGEETLKNAVLPGTSGITFDAPESAPYSAELSTGAIQFSITHAS